jgi:pimeloyl-ACP methyl ester carboxylesterase
MFAKNGAYEIYYDTMGALDARPLLVIHGLGAQCVEWPQGLLDAFVDAGFYVIQFDNRDVGLSTKSNGESYLLSDMASDAVAVLDAVGVERAHVFGVSMGGMIAQTLAIEHPDRVASLTSVMSTTGDPALMGVMSPEAMEMLMTPPPADRDGYIEHNVASYRAFSGPHFDEVFTRDRVAAKYDRCFDPKGVEAQTIAVGASGDRTEKLRALSVPTTVIHGQLDGLLGPPHGEATGAAIPDAKLVMLDEMGHDLPAVHWPIYLEELVTLADRADAR